MNIWNEEKYIIAWNFASSVHNGQFVPGTQIPYINHIGLVAMESMATIAVQNELIEFPDLFILSAVLHDTIEDTATTYQDIQKNLVQMSPTEFKHYQKIQIYHQKKKK